MIIYTEYTLPGNSQILTTPAQSTVYNESQKTEQIAYHNSIAQARIDATLDDKYTPGEEVKTTPELYRG